MAENSVYTDEIGILIPPSIVKGEKYEIKIENVYDPSKFWIIVKYKELAVFMRYLKHFYDKTVNKKPIHRSHLRKKLLCIVYKSGIYFRSIILPLLLPDENKIRVFMIDFGYITNVYIDELLCIFEKHRDVPRFAIRACLAYISPTDCSKVWSQEDLKIFCKIMQSQRICAKVCEIDTQRKILFTDIYILSELSIKSISDMLVDMKLARYNKNYNKDSSNQLTKYKSKVEYPHLFPSFEALECGIVPSSLWERDLLKHSVPLDLLYQNYYQYHDVNCYDN